MSAAPHLIRPARVAPLLSLVLAALSAVSPAPARAEVAYRERVETFEIGVRDGVPEDIWTAIRRYGPFIGGKHAVGSASGRIKWSGQSIARRGHQCRLEGHIVDVEVVMTLPEWWRSRHAPGDELAYWQCIETTVTVHEKRHAEIWRETAAAIDRALHRFDDWMACDELRAAVSETGNRLYQDGVRRQRAFDDEDRRRRRYELCPRPAAAIARGPVTPPRAAHVATNAGAGAHAVTAPARPADGVAVTDRPAAGGSLLVGPDADPETAAATERAPLEALSGLAAALLAILAGIAGYFGLMAGVMAWTQRRRAGRAG